MSSGNKRLLGVCALVLLALAAPSFASAESCPKGQVGAPPYCAKVKFWLQTVRHEGTAAKIRIKVSAPGVVTAAAKYLVTVKATAKKAGRFWLPLKLDKAGIAVLEAQRVLHVRITFTYTPSGGSPLVKHKKIRYVLKGK